MDSSKYTLNKTDLLKIAKGAVIAISGAGLTYALSIINQIDFGPQTLIVVPILTILINAGLKFIQGESR